MSIFGHAVERTSPAKNAYRYYLTCYGSVLIFPPSRFGNAMWELGVGGDKSMHILHTDCKIISASFNCVNSSGTAVIGARPTVVISVDGHVKKTVTMAARQKDVLVHFDPAIEITAGQGLKVRLGTENQSLYETSIALRIEEEH